MNELDLVERLRRLSFPSKDVVLGIGDDCAIYRPRAGEELLCQRKSLAPAEMQTQTFLKVGDPSQQIVATARQWGADLIVLGTHGRAGIEHMLLGSTAESVVRQADCPVLTIGHDPADRAVRLAADPAKVLNSFSMRHS